MRLNIEEGDLDKSIYRLVSLERLLELFVTGQNTLVKPSKWEDTFENFILKSKVRLRRGQTIEYNYFDRMYGQCWTLDKASDAMWRIYSSGGHGLRIKTTIRKLIDSLYDAHPSLTDVCCAVGKVEYLGQDVIMDVANKTFDDSGIAVRDLFRSLLLKRRAFIHEKEVRALYMELDDDSFSYRALYKYDLDPHSFVRQIMIDPRRSHAEFKVLERIIRKTTGFKGEIKRSSLYTLPKDIVLDATDVFTRI